jgi:Skp family chaperone for outer membrane proteins
VGILALSLLVGVGAVVSHAHQDNEARDDGSNIGMVDLEKIYEASDAPQQFAQSAAQIEMDAKSRADAVAAVSQLSETELKEYGDLVGKKTPTAAEKNRIDELKSFSDTRAAHLRDVQTKADAALTPEDKKLMASAAQQQRQFDNVLRMMRMDLNQQVGEREESVKRELVAKLRLEISKVAKERKIDHVFDLSAMVCSTNNITGAVIQKIKHAPKGDL